MTDLHALHVVGPNQLKRYVNTTVKGSRDGMGESGHAPERRAKDNPRRRFIAAIERGIWASGMS
ncbi:MAG: hypothetical protein AB7G15_03740 [Alphaproteobacteria bacterium]